MIATMIATEESIQYYKIITKQSKFNFNIIPDLFNSLVRRYINKLTIPRKGNTLLPLF